MTDNAGKINDGASTGTSKEDLNDSLMSPDISESQLRNCALKGINEQYVELRETARLLMFLIGELGKLNNVTDRKIDDVVRS